MSTVWSVASRSASGANAGFATLHERGLLRVDDPLLAAQQLNRLILSTPPNAAMAGPLVAPLPEADLHRHADAGVRVFLAAYGPG